MYATNSMEARTATRSAMCAIALLALAAGSEAQINDIQPAPASIGADVPATYFGPPPSLVDPRLVGPVQLLKSGTVNVNARVPTITLPLYRGILAKGNKPFYYIVTDTTAKDNAEGLGINHAAKLRYALVPGATRKGSLRRDLTLVTTNGYVDFSPHHSVTAGKAPNYFPPTAYTPGAVGKDGYSPLVELNGEVYNAPIVSMATADQLHKYCAPAGRPLSAAQLQELHKLVHDKVVSVCPNEAGTGGTVELLLTTGFSFGKPVLYLSLDSSSPLAAAIEAVTYAPAMNNITVGGDDSLFSAVERLFTTVNGYTNGDINRAKLRRTDGRPTKTTHPLRQGLGSALRGDGSPLNILGGIPTVATDYSPMWDLNIGRWTDYAVANSYRARLTDEFQYLGFVQRGFITNPDGRPFSSSGIIVNCPIVQRLL